MQAGGELERQRPVPAGAMTAASSIGVGNDARRPARRCGTWRDRRRRREHARARRRQPATRGTSRRGGQREVAGRVERELRPKSASGASTAQRHLEPDQLRPGRRRAGSARACGSLDEAGVGDQRRRSSGSRPGRRRGRRARSRRSATTGTSSGPDQVGVPGGAVPRCAATASASGALPGGKTAASSTSAATSSAARPRSSPATRTGREA